MRFWFDDERRLAAAKQLQRVRLQFLEAQWRRSLPALWPDLPTAEVSAFVARTAAAVDGAISVAQLLGTEAQCSKQLYAWAAHASGYGDFARGERGGAGDQANRLLDHGNYLAYGLAATATWVLGLPHGLALMHGKTRRGALVFDVADLVKDALILPQAFISAVQGHRESEFRQACIEALLKAEALDLMIDTLKRVALTHGAVGA